MKKLIAVIMALLITISCLPVYAAGFTPRLTAPSGTSKYYTSENMYYTSGYGMPNCTCYAYGRAYEILNKQPDLQSGNAGDWYMLNKTRYDSAQGGYPYSADVTKPALGAIAVWTKQGGAGHVAVVEKISGKAVTTSESGWNSGWFWTTQRSSADANLSYSSSYAFAGYIYILNNKPLERTYTKAVTFTSVSRSGFNMYLTAGGSPSATSADFLIWGAKNGSSDLERRTLKPSGGRFAFNVKTSEHGGEAGLYRVDVYLYSSAGCTYQSFGIYLSGTAYNVAVTNISGSGFDVQYRLPTSFKAQFSDISISGSDTEQSFRVKPSNGYIKASGKATALSSVYAIKAYSYNSSYQRMLCQLNISVPTATGMVVTGLRCEPGFSNGIRLIWDKTPGATSYRIYKYDKQSKSYKAYKDVKTLYCDVTGLEECSKEAFRVRACRTASGKAYWGAVSQTLTAYTGPDSVSGLSVKNGVLTWKTSTSATAYRVFRYSSTSRTYEHYRCVRANRCSVGSGVYRIRAYAPFADTEWASGMSAAIRV